jgi:hypothetical protein
VTRDPAGYEDGKYMSLLDYVWDSPTNFDDPFGLQPIIFPPPDPIWPPKKKAPPPAATPPTPISKKPPPTSLLGYGWYCGPTRRANCSNGVPSYGNRQPIDDIDRACAFHDCCLNNKEKYFNRCHHKGCNMAFCTALAVGDCSKAPKPSECDSYRKRALMLCLFTLEWTIPLP